MDQIVSWWNVNGGDKDSIAKPCSRLTSAERALKCNIDEYELESKSSNTTTRAKSCDERESINYTNSQRLVSITWNNIVEFFAAKRPVNKEQQKKHMTVLWLDETCCLVETYYEYGEFPQCYEKWFKIQLNDRKFPRNDIRFMHRRQNPRTANAAFDDATLAYLQSDPPFVLPALEYVLRLKLNAMNEDDRLDLMARFHLPLPLSADCLNDILRRGAQSRRRAASRQVVDSHKPYEEPNLYFNSFHFNYQQTKLLLNSNACIRMENCKLDEVAIYEIERSTGAEAALSHPTKAGHLQISQSKTEKGGLDILPALLPHVQRLSMGSIHIKETDGSAEKFVEAIRTCWAGLEELYVICSGFSEISQDTWSRLWKAIGTQPLLRLVRVEVRAVEARTKQKFDRNAIIEAIQASSSLEEVEVVQFSNADRLRGKYHADQSAGVCQLMWKRRMIRYSRRLEDPALLCEKIQRINDFTNPERFMANMYFWGTKISPEELEGLKLEWTFLLVQQLIGTVSVTK